MNIKKSIATAAVMAIGLAIGVPARADTYYNFSYSDSSKNMASGTLSIGAVNGSGFDITGITGTFDGHNVTGLLAPGTCCSPPNNNNVFYLSSRSRWPRVSELSRRLGKYVLLDFRFQLCSHCERRRQYSGWWHVHACTVRGSSPCCSSNVCHRPRCIISAWLAQEAKASSLVGA